MTLTAMPLYPWLTRFSRYPFCSSVFPLGGILMSTCTPASFSYLCTPAAAIFQNSLALLVTNASFSALGSEALTILIFDAFAPPDDDDPPPLLVDLLSLSLLLQETATTSARVTRAVPIRFKMRIPNLL